MKKLLLLILVLAYSCTNNNPERFVYAFSKNAGLEIIQNEGSYMQWGNIIEGSNLVFEYEFHAEDDENIADDEYSEYIRFEIDANSNEFQFEGAALSDIKLTLTQSCFCGFFDEEKDVPATGTISGTKISENRWAISIDVTFYGDQRRTFTSNFYLKN